VGFRRNPEEPGLPAEPLRRVKNGKIMCHRSRTSEPVVCGIEQRLDDSRNANCWDIGNSKIWDLPLRQHSSKNWSFVPSKIWLIRTFCCGLAVPTLTQASKPFKVTTELDAGGSAFSMEEILGASMLGGPLAVLWGTPLLLGRGLDLPKHGGKSAFKLQSWSKRDWVFQILELAESCKKLLHSL